MCNQSSPSCFLSNLLKIPHKTKYPFIRLFPMNRRLFNNNSSSSSDGPSTGTRLKRKISSIFGGNKISPLGPPSTSSPSSSSSSGIHAFKEYTSPSSSSSPRPLKRTSLEVQRQPAQYKKFTPLAPPPAYENVVGPQEPPRYSFFKHNTYLRFRYKPVVDISTPVTSTTDDQMDIDTASSSSHALPAQLSASVTSHRQHSATIHPRIPARHQSLGSSSSSTAPPNSTPPTTSTLPPPPPPVYWAGQGSVLGTRYFNNPDASSCIVKIEGLHGLESLYHVHSLYLSPMSGFFRDLLNPDEAPNSLAFRIDTSATIPSGDHPPGSSSRGGKAAVGGELTTFYSIHDLPISEATSYHHQEATKKFATNFYIDLIGTVPRHCLPDTNNLTFESVMALKYDFFSHVREYKSDTLIKNLRSGGGVDHHHRNNNSGNDNNNNNNHIWSSSLPPSKTKNRVPILSIKVPHPYLLPALLKWMYSGSLLELFDHLDFLDASLQGATVSGAHAFRLLELAKHLQLTPFFYSSFAKYFILHGDLTLSRRFHHSLIPPATLQTFMSQSRWNPSDKLAVMLWWARGPRDDSRLKVRETSGDILDDDLSFKDDVQNMKTDCRCFSPHVPLPHHHRHHYQQHQHMQVCPAIPKSLTDQLLGLYISFDEIDTHYSSELQDLLPLTFERVIKPARA